MVILIGLIVGILIGLLIPVFYEASFVIYISVGLMAAIDSLLGALRANLDGKFNKIVFISGFFTNAIVATFLAYIGDMLGLPLYYCALFVFGTRLFDNIAIIRRHIIAKYSKEEIVVKE